MCKANRLYQKRKPRLPAIAKGELMPDDQRFIALQEHFDRRLEQLYQALDTRTNKKDDDLVNLRVALGRLDARVDDCLRQNSEVNKAVSVAVNELKDTKEQVTQQVTNLQDRINELFHLKAYGRGLLVPLTFVAGLLALGAGEMLKNFIDGWLKSSH